MADYSITGDTRLDTSGFTKGVSSMTVAAGNLISDLTKTAATKLAGLAKASVSVGMNFDASMSQVAATMGTTVDQIDNLTKVAKEMGSTTKFTATQAADALNYLALAGYNADKAAEVLPSVLNLAAAGGMDLAYASDLVTDAMASLNIEANKQNVDDFGNKLAKAASKANANVSQLGEAILTVGGTAANLKGGTTELTTALGLLANVGIKSAEGGTHLRNIILSLQSPTDDATKLMQKLGLQVYDAQGNMRGLNEILGDLNGALDGMTQGQKDSIINQLFNKTDLAAVNGLLAAQGEQWDTLAAQIDSADGAMGQMAETQIDNLQGAMTIMSSAFEGMQLAVYDELEPALTEAVKWGTDCISTLTSSLTEGGPEAMLAAAGEIISDLADGIAEQLPGLMTTSVEIITQLAEDIVAATPAMLDTAAEVLGALAQGLVDNIPDLIASAAEVIAGFIGYLGDHADEMMTAGLQIIESLIIGITDNLPGLIEAAGATIAKFAAALISHLPKILECAAALMTTLVDGIFYSLENLAEAALACVAKLVGVWDGSMNEWGHIGENIVSGLLNGIKGAWNSLTKWVSNGINGLVSGVKGLLGIHSPSKVFSEIGLNICRGLAEGLTTNAPLAEDAAKQVVASVTHTTEALTGSMQTVTKTVTEILKDGTETQKQVITETYDDVVDGALVTIERVKTLAADGTVQVAETTKKSAADTFDGLWKEIQTEANTGVLGTFDDLYTAVKNQDWLSIGKWVASTIYSGLTADQKQQVQSFALGIVGKLNEALGGARDQLVQGAIDLGSQIAGGLTSGFGDIISQFSGLGSILVSVFQGLQGPLSAVALAISKGLQGGLISAFPEILASLGGLIGAIGSAFVAMLQSIGMALLPTGFGTPKGLLMIAAGVALVAAIAGIVAALGGSFSKKGSSGGGTSGGSSGGSGIGGSVDITTGTGSLEDAINANTKALEKTNSALADMIRQAGALVLSDNMRLGSTVAASGTAQVVSAANSYHREGDTTINQYIQSKAQTAADLARETRWEADKARRQRR